MSTKKMDNEKQSPETADADAALDYLVHEQTGAMTEVDEKKLLRKIDWWIIPLMCMSLGRCCVDAMRVP